MEAERGEKSRFGARVITFGWPLEFGKEFLHPVAHHLHLVVSHHPVTPRNQESLQNSRIKKQPEQKLENKPRGPDDHRCMRSILRRLLEDDILESGETRTAPEGPSSPIRFVRRLWDKREKGIAQPSHRTGSDGGPARLRAPFTVASRRPEAGRPTVASRRPSSPRPPRHLDA